ncbi:hypothetical protein [Geobacillus kaustophilus]|uniref:hypothetical protein n=1 Tax=Geobacillus kaustophilus TaxID=1462 RepID=UPI0005CD7E30|nr:hypothetical protein [Geobacillus kaustophilus]
MNDKERLQLAKELLSIMKSRHKFSEMMSIESVDIETMEWLINRAEKVEQLEQEIEEHVKLNNLYYQRKEQKENDQESTV